jgi:hypothetical protein
MGANRQPQHRPQRAHGDTIALRKVLVAGGFFPATSSAELYDQSLGFNSN